MDPALDAAALLRRLGFFGLFVALPVCAQVSRRATVVLAPIAVVLLITASAIDRRQRAVDTSLRRLLTAPAFLAGMLVVFWSALSLAWTPFPGPASERFGNLLFTVAMTLLAYLALPDRMRSANLYLLPLGVGAASVVAILIALAGDVMFRGTPNGDSALERGAIVIALLVWPAVAWLRSRRRDTESLVLAVLAAAALVTAPVSTPLFALAIGALAFALTHARVSLGVRVTATVAAGLLVFAPLLPFLARPVGVALLGPTAPGVLALKAWQKLVALEPLRLITGHGLETALRGRVFGIVPANAPTTMLFELWYELGIVGAFAMAFALYRAIHRTGRDATALVPCAMAAFATAFAIGGVGVGLTVVWWLTTVALTILTFVAVERGQFRHSRPKVGRIPRLPVRGGPQA